MTNKHQDFITEPMTKLIEEAILASSPIRHGIESFALNEYLLQSLFIRMTGFQEQKFKCISWEIATHDFEYRRRLLENSMKLGEHSTYEAKKTIYRTLFKSVKKFDSKFDYGEFSTIELRDGIVSKSYCNLKELFQNSFFQLSNEASYSYFISDFADILTPNQFLRQDTALLEADLKGIYEEMINCRNQIAHNALSYQKNLPILDQLAGSNDGTRNYFSWFSILILIDEIMIASYSLYLKVVEESPYV